MLKELKRVEAFVKDILEKNPKSRESNKYLYLIACDRCGLKLTDTQKQTFLKMPDFEALTRAGREIRSKNPLLRPKNFQGKLLEERKIKNYYSN